tara:strand:+ start:258 stop:494 length:237 start_codon:yes stop_codon:yes gene_type:complete
MSNQNQEQTTTAGEMMQTLKFLCKNNDDLIRELVNAMWATDDKGNRIWKPELDELLVWLEARGIIHDQYFYSFAALHE